MFTKNAVTHSDKNYVTLHTTLKRACLDLSNQKQSHNSSHFRDANRDTSPLSTRKFVSSILSKHDLSSESLCSAQTHIFVITTTISKEHLVTVMRVGTNVSREVHEIPFPYFWTHKSRNCRTLKKAAKNKTKSQTKSNST